MRIVIDRLYDTHAVLDVDGEIIEFPKAALPEGCKEGDILGFVTLDSTQILQEGADRIKRMQAMSSTTSGNTFDL